MAAANPADRKLNHKAALNDQPVYQQKNVHIFAGDDSAAQWYWPPLAAQIDQISPRLTAANAVPTAEAMYLYRIATEPPLVSPDIIIEVTASH